MQMLSLRASLDDESNTGSRQDDSVSAGRDPDHSHSTYKGRENEVDLNHCFTELERVLNDHLQQQDQRMGSLINDRDQMASAVSEKTQDLETIQGQYEEAQKKVKERDEAIVALETQLKTTQEEAESQRQEVESGEKQIAQLRQDLEEAQKQASDTAIALANAQK